MALGGDLTPWLLSQLTQGDWGIPRVTLLLSAPQQRRLTVFVEAKQTGKPWEKTSRLLGKTDAHLGQGRQMQSCHRLVPWASRGLRQEPVTQVLREERGTCGGPAGPLLQPQPQGSAFRADSAPCRHVQHFRSSAPTSSRAPSSLIQEEDGDSHSLYMKE